MKKAINILRKVFYTLVLVTLVACSGLTPPAPTTSAPTEVKVQQIDSSPAPTRTPVPFKKYAVAIFSGGGSAEVFEAEEIHWSDKGLKFDKRTELFSENSLLCVTDTQLTGGGDCRTVDLFSPDINIEPFVIVDTPAEIFAAMHLSEAIREDIGEGKFLAIFTDVNGNPVHNEAIRAAFLMLNRLDGTVVTNKGIFIRPSGSASVCVYHDDGTGMSTTLRECMPLKLK